MFHGIQYLIVSLVFSHLGFWSGNLFLIAPFPDLCLLVPFYIKRLNGILQHIRVYFILSCMQQIIQESKWAHESFKGAQWFIYTYLCVFCGRKLNYKTEFEAHMYRLMKVENPMNVHAVRNHFELNLKCHGIFHPAQTKRLCPNVTYEVNKI